MPKVFGQIHFLKVFAACCLSLFISHRSHALVNGTINTTLDSVVQLTSVLSQSDNPNGDGTKINHVLGCTGALVGLHPITVITARHCVHQTLGVYLGHTLDWQATHIFESNFGKQPFDSATHAVPGDIAVLIFDGTPDELSVHVDPHKDLFSVAPIAVQSEQMVSICGYGLTNNKAVASAIDNQRRCGENFLELENQAFQPLSFLSVIKRFPVGSQINDSDLVGDEEKIEYYHHEIQIALNQYGAGTRLAIGPFTANDFDPSDTRNYKINFSATMINEGDSGGPWFIDDQNQTPHLIAITSIRNYTTDLALASGIAWRLDNAWSKYFLKQASDKGADILGLAELLKVSP
jgi:hypothetical protein